MFEQLTPNIQSIKDFEDAKADIKLKAMNVSAAKLINVNQFINHYKLSNQLVADLIQLTNIASSKFINDIEREKIDSQFKILCKTFFSENAKFITENFLSNNDQDLQSILLKTTAKINEFEQYLNLSNHSLNNVTLAVNDLNMLTQIYELQNEIINHDLIIVSSLNNIISTINKNYHKVNINSLGKCEAENNIKILPIISSDTKQNYYTNVPNLISILEY